MARKAKVAVAVVAIAMAIMAVFVIAAYLGQAQEAGTVPHLGRYGIYSLEISTGKVALLYSTDNEIYTSSLRLNTAGDALVFAQKVGGTGDNSTEIFTIGIDGKNLARVTTNGFWDLYPAWSPDGEQIAFLSKRGLDLDIYVMGRDGGNQRLLYDSGTNDADIDWGGNTIVFTSNFTIWRMRDDGTMAQQVTYPSNAGGWGTANLPAGDYDPRLSPDGQKIAFERLEDPNSTHGVYDIFTVNIDGHAETRLTDTGHAQGLPSWSHAGDRVVYTVAAINDTGKYDMYLVNADGTNNHDVTPSYFPAGFLCYTAIFTKDDSRLLFIGQWSQ